MKFSSTRILSVDVPRLASFYADVTGVSPVGTPEYTEIGTTGAVLALCSVDAVRAASPNALPDTPGITPVNTSVILEFEVDDVDVMRQRLDGRVGEWVQEPTDQPWGNRSMLLRDPDGNLVNLFTAIPDANRNWPSQGQA
ncbi:VOC family protein [Streptomyces javensis]|uniref:VOC family protein n=1 Tax=Streptomyces javensis TaxID=114698 RepID=UPI0033FEA924